MALERIEQQQLTPAVVHQILLVEDDVNNAAALKSLLESHRYQVTVARDGGQAHAAFVMRKPDFVILDVMLPGAETGFEICERFKQSEKSVPVLFLTAIDLDDARELALRVGCDGYLTKPFEPRELLALIPQIADRVWMQTHGQVPAAAETHVRFHCRCGKRLKVSAAHRGKSLTCPQCGEALTVPRHV